MRLPCISLRAGLHAFERKSRRKPPAETNHLRCNLTEDANINGRKRGGEGLAEGAAFLHFCQQAMYRKLKACEQENHFNNNAIKRKGAFSLTREAVDQKRKWGHKDRAKRLWIWWYIIHSCGEQCYYLNFVKDHFAISSLEYLCKSTCGYAYTIIMRFTVMQEKTSVKTVWKELKHYTSKTSDNKENILRLIFKNVKSRHDLMIIYLKFKISAITCKKIDNADTPILRR